MSNASSKFEVPAETGMPAAADGAELPKKSWGPAAAVIWALIVYLLPQIVVGGLLVIYPELKHWSGKRTADWLSNSVAAQFAYTILVEAVAVSMIWKLLRHYRAGFAAIGIARSRRKDAAYALAGFGLYFVVYLAAAAILTKLVPALNVSQQQNVGFQNATTTVSLVMTFASLVILPPIAEEIIFRGFVFSGFRRKFGFMIAALGTSVLFAAPHLLEGTGGGLLWIAGVDTFILSMTLCYLREKTGRLWAGMVVHALKNGLAFATLFVFHAH
jgi:hypothetical protein